MSVTTPARTPRTVSGFETDVLAGFVLARASPGLADGTIRSDVVEWERRSLRPDRVLIEKSFRNGDGALLLSVEERWVYLRALDLDAALDRAGFDVTGADHGYGDDRSPHRRVYHARRRP